MSRNNNYQQLQELVSSIPSLRTQQKDIVCSDCGGISTTKIQELLATMEGTRQLLPNKKKIVRKKKYSPRKTSSIQRKKKKIIRKRISNSTKQRKFNIKKLRSSRKQ